MRLEGKTALATGAASGFGAEIARVFAREGAKVVLFDLNGPGAEALAAEIGDRARAVATEFGGGFDIVVNNAGWTHRNKPLPEVTEEEFDRVYAINVKAIFHMVSAAVPRMKGRGGVMINVGSTAGIRPRPGLTWYNSTKGAVNLLTRSLAVELAPERIRVNCIAPVMGATGLLESFMGVPDTPESDLVNDPMGRVPRRMAHEPDDHGTADHAMEDQIGTDDDGETPDPVPLRPTVGERMIRQELGQGLDPRPHMR